MGLFTKLFGSSGELKFSGITLDNRIFNGKTKIETIGMTAKEVLEALKQKTEFEKDIKVKSLEITDFLEN